MRQEPRIGKIETHYDLITELLNCDIDVFPILINFATLSQLETVAELSKLKKDSLRHQMCEKKIHSQKLAM